MKPEEDKLTFEELRKLKKEFPDVQEHLVLYNTEVIYIVKTKLHSINLEKKYGVFFVSTCGGFMGLDENNRFVFDRRFDKLDPALAFIKELEKDMEVSEYMVKFVSNIIYDKLKARGAKTFKYDQQIPVEILSFGGKYKRAQLCGHGICLCESKSIGMGPADDEPIVTCLYGWNNENIETTVNLLAGNNP